MQNQVSFLKYLLTCAIGFGIGGAIWGWLNFRGYPTVDYPLNIFGVISILTGAIGLSIHSKNTKQILKTVGFGSIGGIIGILVAFFGIYPLSLAGSLIALILPSTIIDWSGIGSMPIITYWLNFFVAGVFIGLFFAFALKTKIWPMVWRGAVGFGLAAIISPIVGNIIGNALNSLFVSYLVTFALIGAILGKFLGWGTYKNLKL